MTAEWILKVFLDSYEERRDPLQGVEVIPAVSDALPHPHQELVKDIVRGLEGQTLPLAELGVSGIAGKTANRQDLQTGIANHLRLAIPPGGELKWSTVDGLVKATFGPGRDKNESAPILLGAAVLPFAVERLGASETAAVLWDDDALDPQGASAVWNILMDLAGQHIGQLKRLFLFVSGRARMDLHIDSPRPTRYWVHGGLTDRVKRPAHLAARVEGLAKHCAEGKPLVLFLGAGFSMSSGDDPQNRLPLGDALRDRALEDMFGVGGTVESRLERFHELVVDGDLWTPAERARGLPSPAEFISSLTLERVLLVEFEDRRAKSLSPTLQRLVELNAQVITAPSVGVRRLGDLARAGVKLVLLTVNFDTLVETVCGDAVRTLRTPEELESSPAEVAAYLASEAEPGSTDRRIPLLKLHGSIDELESVVADVKTVATGLPAGVPQALSQLRNEEDPLPWVYVGHSMRDRDLVPLIEQRDFALGTHETWVAPAIPDSVKAFVADCRSAHWNDHGLSVRHVTVTADRFFSELHQRLLS